MDPDSVTFRFHDTAFADRERQFPGFHLPIQHLPDQRFQHAIADSVNVNPITTRELRMLGFMNQVTDKPDWTSKVFDDTITAKWKQEGQQACHDSHYEDIVLSEKMFDYCIAELQDKARRFAETGFVSVLDTDQHCTITKSDSVISLDILKSLKELVKPLEDVPNDQKDWHPGSNGKVLDLVHPSLFPVVYGRSRAETAYFPRLSGNKDRCRLWTTKGRSVMDPPDAEAAKYQRPPTFAGGASFIHGWGSYQWLPSDIELRKDGKSGVSIASYINNLHPEKHVALYGVLETIVDATLPFWNEVLTTYDDRTRIDVQSTSDADFVLIMGRKYPHKITPDGLEVVLKNKSDDETDEDLTYDEDYRLWKRDNSRLQWPEPKSSYRPYSALLAHAGVTAVNLKEQFGDAGLQIIFKLANIHLTPERHEYEGGAWHIEGALNEHIAASAILYYDQENITDSRLCFRHSIDGEELIMMPDQNEHESAEEFFGVSNDGTNEQDIGSVLTKQGRLLCFPNTLQHRVEPFELADPTKPGHRKILAMFLVDPHIPIISTANVPPQREDWWREWEAEVAKIECFSKLPLEIWHLILAELACERLSWDEAVEIREKLMVERSNINFESISSMVETFSFCEH